MIIPGVGEVIERLQHDHPGWSVWWDVTYFSASAHIGSRLESVAAPTAGELAEQIRHEEAERGKPSGDSRPCPNCRGRKCVHDRIPEAVFYDCPACDATGMVDLT